jgi:hypothetical protein
VDVLNDLRVYSCDALRLEIDLGGLHRIILEVKEKRANRSRSPVKFRKFNWPDFARDYALGPFIRTLERVQTWFLKIKYYLLTRVRGDIAALLASHALCASIGLARSSLCITCVYNINDDLDVTERPIQSCSTPGSKATTKSNMLSQVDNFGACG